MPDDRWEEYSAVVAAPPRASPECPGPADKHLSDAAKAHSDGARSNQANDSRHETAQAADEPAATDAAVHGMDEADDDRKAQSPAGRTASPLAASPLRSGDGGQALQPPSQSAAEVPSPDRFVALVLCRIYHLCVIVSPVLKLLSASKSLMILSSGICLSLRIGQRPRSLALQSLSHGVNPQLEELTEPNQNLPRIKRNTTSTSEKGDRERETSAMMWHKNTRAVASKRRM